MKNAVSARKTARYSERNSVQGRSAGYEGAAIAPPACGIDVVDHQSVGMELEYNQAEQSLESTTWPAQSHPIQRKSGTIETNSGSLGPNRPNKTGLPDKLKARIETLSGMAMDDVRVHYNSTKPSQLQALAYTQGTDIHVGPGQERHLPHEAWHVVQQKQGDVQPTTQYRGVTINDSPALEREANVMGAKAAQMKQIDSLKLAEKTGNSLSLLPRSIIPIQRMEWEPTNKVTRLRSSSRSGRVQSANVENLVKNYILMNQEKVEFNRGMSGGWERWLQGEIFFLLSQKLGAHIAVEDKVYTAGGQRADFTLETSDGDTLIVIELKCQTAIETNTTFNGRVEKDTQKLGTIDKQNLNYGTIQAFQLALSPQYYPYIGDTEVGLWIERTLV